MLLISFETTESDERNNEEWEKGGEAWGVVVKRKTKMKKKKGETEIIRR